MPNEGIDNRGVQRSRQACLNCRRKKVKCHGEQPRCSFCARLRQDCVYTDRQQVMPSNSVLSELVSSDKNQDYQTLASRISQIESKLNILTKNTGLGLEMLPLDWPSPVPNNFYPSHALPNISHNIALSPERIINEPSILPPIHVQWSTINHYFEYCHNQPYSFFHEESFRCQFSNGMLPEYLIASVLAIALRYSSDPFYGDHKMAATSRYASKAWKDVVAQCFESEEGPDYRLVQAATLLALHDFTGNRQASNRGLPLTFLACNHRAAWIKIGIAVSIAQALHMMSEPSESLSWAAQEERRRTFWSIYLLDKMAACGRGRPSLFQDENCQLQLPCNESAFRTSDPEVVSTLEEFKSLNDYSMNADSFALTVVVASTLSMAASYTFQHNNMASQKPPWDHSSDYVIISSQISRFETYFDRFQPIQDRIGNLRHEDGVSQLTESFIFSYALYNLCHCLLQHPFLLRRRLEVCGARFPTSFLSSALESCWSHAQEFTFTLDNAQRAGYKVAATMLGYSSLVIGTVNSLFQHSGIEAIRTKSLQALKCNLNHLEQKGSYWKNAASMEAALKQFCCDSAKYCKLIDPSLQSVPLSPMDVDRLYSICDYGTMSTSYIPRNVTLGTEAIDPTCLTQSRLREPNPISEMDDRSRQPRNTETETHIEGVHLNLSGHIVETYDVRESVDQPYNWDSFLHEN